MFAAAYLDSRTGIAEITQFAQRREHANPAGDRVHQAHLLLRLCRRADRCHLPKSFQALPDSPSLSVHAPNRKAPLRNNGSRRKDCTLVERAYTKAGHAVMFHRGPQRREHCRGPPSNTASTQNYLSKVRAVSAPIGKTDETQHLSWRTTCCNPRHMRSQFMMQMYCRGLSSWPTMCHDGTSRVMVIQECRRKPVLNET